MGELLNHGWISYLWIHFCIGCKKFNHGWIFKSWVQSANYMNFPRYFKHKRQLTKKCPHTVIVSPIGDTRRYSPLCGLTISSGGGLFMLFLLCFALLWCSVVTSVTLGSTLSNFEKIQNNSKKNPKYRRHQLSRPMWIVAPIFFLKADSIFFATRPRCPSWWKFTKYKKM